MKNSFENVQFLPTRTTDNGVKFVVFKCNYSLILPICSVLLHGKSHQTSLKNLPLNVALLTGKKHIVHTSFSILSFHKCVTYNHHGYFT